VTAPISDCDAFDLLAELADGGTVSAEHCRMLQDWAQRMCGDKDYAQHELFAARFALAAFAAQKQRRAA
jgi:hypothetical protein